MDSFAKNADEKWLVVVTPVLNGAEFIEETISNVVSQRGNFMLRYHIQDGGSSDGTVELIRKWERQLTGSVDQHDRQLVFSWDSSKDCSMYAAINSAYAHAYRSLEEKSAECSIMTWINAGDLFSTNSFAAASAFFDQHTEFDWLTGMAAIISESGVPLQVYSKPEAFSQRDLAFGYHDGRRSPFVPQEGTFWRRSLWDRAGGLDTTLKSAGDWDLWRRFAQFAALAKMEMVLGYHRLHRGQLSENRQKYYSEVDCNVERVPSEAELRNFGFKIVFDGNLKRWHAQRVDGI